MNEGLIAALNQSGLDLTVTEIAEMIWLAARLPRLDSSSETKSQPTTTPSDSRIPPSTPTPVFPAVPSEPTSSDKSSHGYDQRMDQTDVQAGLFADGTSTTSKPERGLPAIPIRSPSPLKLAQKLSLGRALRPLLHKRPSTTQYVIDETKTARQIADTGLWQVVRSPMLGRWLDVDLVVEQSSNMSYWGWLVDEFEGLLRSTGAFRHLRRWQLHLESTDKLSKLIPYSRSSSGSLRRPAEITSYAGGRAIIWISDCTAPAWHDGRVLPLLDLWSRKSLLSLLPVLPYRLWQRTGLRNAFETRLRSPNLARHNSEFQTQPPRLWPFDAEYPITGIPVFSLDEKSLAKWAKLIGGMQADWMPGLAFPPASQEVLGALRSAMDETLPIASIDSDKRVERFYAASSPTAWELAIYLSVATPLNLSIMRLIQESMLRGSEYDHLIEVLLGGILRPVSCAGMQAGKHAPELFEFFPGVREQLGSYLPRDQAVEVLKATSLFISQRTGTALDFSTLLANPDLVSDLKLDESSREFAYVTAQVLRRYGGQYAQLAEKLKDLSGQRSVQRSENIEGHDPIETELHKVEESIYKMEEILVEMRLYRDELLRLTRGTKRISHAEQDINAIGGFVNDSRVKTETGGVIVGDDFMPSVIHVEPSPDNLDPAQLRLAYINHLLESAGQLSLSSIDHKAARENDTRLRLSEVYTALMTLSSDSRHRMDKQEMSGEMQRLSALEQLEREPRLVLLGEPGSGKSTFVNFVTICLAGEILGSKEVNLATLTAPLPEDRNKAKDEKTKPQPWTHGALLPVRVVLRDFAARGLPPYGEKATAKHLWAFIKSELAAAALEAYEPHLERALFQQGGLLLLDGLDEVPEAEQRRVEIKQVIEDFAAAFPRCRILVTSRTYAYQKQDWRLQNFAEALLAPFSPAQIEHFIERWYAHIALLRGMNKDEAQGRAAQLKGVIHASDRLAGLAERPQLLTLLASLHAWHGGTLPEKREEFYADIVDLLLDWWESSKLRRGPGETVSVIEPSLVEWLKVDRARMRQLLDQAAFTAHAAQPELQGTADVAEYELVAGLLRLSNNSDVKPKRLIEYLSQRAGLLLPRGEGVYTFPHRTLQEYLAACYLTSHDYPDAVAELVCQDFNRWREVALLAGAKAGRGAASSLWALADALCYDELPLGECAVERLWGVHLAGQLLAENIDPGAVSKRDLSKLGRVQRGLVRVLQGDELPALERVKAGDILAILDDPRFDPDCFYLPREPMMGFVKVPAGVFTMGDDSKDAVLNSVPPHQVSLDTYYIARYPTTTAQFRVFVDDSGYKPKDPGCLRSGVNYPVIMVTWHDAQAYGEWLDGKLRSLARKKLASAVDEVVRLFWEELAAGGMIVGLPSEAEWEKAARGVDGRCYPWGEQADPNRANYTDTGVGHTSAVGCFPVGVTPYGALDMVGNTEEWTSSLYKNYPYNADDGREDQKTDGGRAVRGGSWNAPSSDTRCAYRRWYTSDYRDISVGFRVGVVPARK